jgi:hypothetical protein
MKMTHTLAEEMTLTVLAKVTKQELLLQLRVEVHRLQLSHH